MSVHEFIDFFTRLDTAAKNNTVANKIAKTVSLSLSLSLLRLLVRAWADNCSACACFLFLCPDSVVEHVTGHVERRLRGGLRVRRSLIEPVGRGSRQGLRECLAQEARQFFRSRWSGH